MADLYKNLLLILTKRMCDFDKDQVEYWVDRDYFPAQKCLDIVREKKNLLAEAKLLEKLNDCKAAIQIYLEVISKINTKRMTDQLLMVKKNECSWGELTQHAFLNRFDATLEKACVIAEKKFDSFGRNLGNAEGDEVYFLILEFLQQYLIAAGMRLDKMDKKSTLQ